MKNEKIKSINDDTVLDYIASMIEKNNEVDCTKTTFEKNGCSLLIKYKKTNDIKKLKFKYRHLNGDNILGWYTHLIHESFINDENIDYIVFSICNESKSKHLLLSKAAIKELLSDKKVDVNGNYLLCFNIKEDSVVEVDKEEKDVTRYVDHWKL